MSCGTRDRVVRQRPAALVAAPARPLPLVRRADRAGATRLVELVDGAARRRLRPRASASRRTRSSPSFFCPVARRDLGDRPRAPHRPEPDRRCRRRSIVLVAQTALHPSAEWASAALGAAALPLLAALAYPAGMGMGDVKLALLLGAMLGRTVAGRADARHARGARARASCSSPATASRRARWRSRSRRSSRSARWSRSSPGTRCSTRTSACSDALPARPIAASSSDARRGTQVGRTAAGRRGVRADSRAGDRRPLPVRRRSRELVADLIAATQLSRADQLASSRGRAGADAARSRRRSSTRASRPADGLARTLASRYQLPLVDLARRRGRQPTRRASSSRCTCSSASSRVPYALDGDRLHVAVADPANIHGIDELRLATRHPARARRRLARRHPSRDQRSSPASRGGRRGRRRSTRRDEAVSASAGRATTSRPTTASPTRRSSGSSTRSSSRPPRTAPATSTSSRRRTRWSCASASTACSTRCSASRSGMANGVTTRLKVLAKLDIAERRKPQDGRISLNAARRPGACSTSASRRCRRSRASRSSMRLLDKSQQGADARGARPLGGHAREARGDHPPADRRAARHRADRLG